MEDQTGSGMHMRLPGGITTNNNRLVTRLVFQEIYSSLAEFGRFVFYFGRAVCWMIFVDYEFYINLLYRMPS